MQLRAFLALDRADSRILKMTAEPPGGSIIELYERHAREFDRCRGRSLDEQHWLDRFLSHIGRPAAVLDLGCGMAEPIGRYLIGAGCELVGVDSSPTLIEMCRERFPLSTWMVGDMREVVLGRRFAGIVAWDSFFHLNAEDQRGMFPRFADHALPGAPLMFTTGPSEGEAIGTFGGEPLYHASLDPTAYEQLLSENGFIVREFKAEDPTCGGHTVWLATYEPEPLDPPC